MTSDTRRQEFRGLRRLLRPTVHVVHAENAGPALATRFSPSRFDPDHTVDDEELTALLEAARWAPSAGNSQPWGFFPARRGEPAHERLAAHLAPSSARWALDAALLIATAAHRLVDDSDMQYSEFADYDLGQAVAHLTIQAHALGLASHQFRAFGLDGLTRELRPRPGWAIVSMIAIGRAAEEPREDRHRNSIAEICAAPWDPAPPC